MANPQAFYQGSPASYADIEANLDISRTQYVRSWKDDRGEIRRPWKDEILPVSAGAKPIITFLVGYRGTGRTTLLRRIAHDLSTASLPCVDLLLSGLTPAHVAPLLQLAAAAAARPYVVAALDDVQTRADLQPVIETIRQLAAAAMSPVIFLRVSESEISMVQAIIEPAARQLGYSCRAWRLRAQLDNVEMGEMLDHLTTHKCLFFLQGKPKDYQIKVLARKSKRSLIATLLEATRAPEGGEFPQLVWDEFRPAGRESGSTSYTRSNHP